MSTEWLTAESFERNQRLISAINTISIYTKLARKGVTDIPEIGDVAEARKEVHDFLDRMEPMLHTVEAERDAPLLGADQRMSLLVRQFASMRRQRPRSILHTLPIEHAAKLLESNTPANMDKLIEYLRALRILVEQHTYADIVNLLGEL
jgi:hypothetical protein